ncbi:MAG: hypothetical protein KKB51_10865 [Candidatus Riflebacteria bacterium]|nr:hypothetical protein [Candidatus Riflebacteria bacterium]
MGSEGDIEKATKDLSVAIKNCGSGDLPARFRRGDEEEHSLQQIDQVEALVKASLKRALRIAEKVLSQEKQLLLRVSAFLADQRIMTRERFQALFDKYATDAGKARAKAFNYRQHLFRQLANGNQSDLPRKSKALIVEAGRKNDSKEAVAAFEVV